MENENTPLISSDHMVKILLKENEQLKAQLFKNKEFKGNSTLSSLLEVLQLQRKKIDSLESKNKKMVQKKGVLLEQLKGLEMRNKTQTFYYNANNPILINNTTDYSASSKSQTMRQKSNKMIKVNIKPNENQPQKIKPKNKPSKKKKKTVINSCVIEKKTVEEEISKIPYDYDNLLGISLNGTKNKPKPQQ